MTRENTVIEGLEHVLGQIRDEYPVSARFVKDAIAALSAAPIHEDDWSELERLARDAGDGLWQAAEETVEYAEAPGIPIALLDPEGMYTKALGLQWAAFIAAANPATILKLIASARAAHEGEGEPVAWRFHDGAVKGPADGSGDMFDFITADGREYRAQKHPNFWHLVSLWRPHTAVRAAPPPSVEVFGSSAEGADTHRDADGAVLGALTDVATLADKLINGGGLQNRGVGVGLVFVEKKDRSDPHYQLCVALETLAKVRQQAAVRAAEQVGTSVASEPKPSVEVERLREALSEIIDISALSVVGGDDFDKGARAARLQAAGIARAALSRKQEPGVPTPGGEGE